MTNETRERIKQYKDALPVMKDKVVAAAFMLVVALTVTVTATYAWVTLSAAPEVIGVDTTVTSNGSLEIALANGTGSAPTMSAVGDSTGAGKAVSAANVTWGNLVNLSDPTYGLTNITLRPAALNGTSGLLTNPLYGVGYGEDGRVSSMVTDDDFAYVYFDKDSGKFLVDMDDSHLGVRAISTVKYENLEGDNTLAELLQYTNQNLTTAKNNYASMTNENQEPGKSYISSLEGLIQIYAQNVIDRKSTTTLDITAYVENLYEMMKYFKDSVMMPAGESYVQMANMLELMKGSGSADAGYTVETLVAASRNGSLPDYIKNNISSLPQFAADYNQLAIYLTDSEKGDFSDLTTSQKNNSLAYWAYYAANGGTVYWSNLNTQINWICDINTATLDGYTLSALSNMSNATKILTGSNPHDAVIRGGAIYRMEQRIGQKMSPTITVTVDASSIVSFLGKVKLTAVLTTSAIDPYTMTEDRDTIKSFNTGSFKGDTATAEDTYAMAIDLWVRTNAGSDGKEITETIEEVLEDGSMKTTTITKSPEKAYLTLEGTVVMGQEEKQTTMKDANGEEQPAYTASFSVNGESVQMNVFERYGSYFYIDEETGAEHDLEAEITEAKESGENVSDVTYTPQITQQNVVVGYEGVNRVWDEEQMAGFTGSGTSTTQGGGSCYVFYADTPADQSRFLELLGSMKVVFVNAQGRQIGAASMDTKNYFAETGKVTVPLVLDKTQAINLGTDMDGNAIYGLTPLTKNAATRITALIYLDGTKLTNDMVLASGDIQGTLNIQFGSSTALMTSTVVEEGGNKDTTIEYQPGKDSVAVEDEEVMNQFVEISARVSETSFEYDPDRPAQTTLSVTVDGIEANSVSARFMRAISSTQGSLQDSVTLSGSGSEWSAVCSFNRPGNYVLRSVWVNGQEYSLDTPVKVTVTGSSVNSVTCSAITDGSNRATVMTANSSFSTNMTLGFSSSKAVPSSVKGIFMDEEGRQVNVPFYLKDDVWTGTARFTSSGTFTMKYVEIDGDTYELNKSLQPTLEILLGLKVRTWITASDEMLAKLQTVLPTALATNFVLDKSKTGDVTLQVSAEIYDNVGNEIHGLSNVKLYYGRAGSSVSSTGLDTNLVWDAASGRYTGDFHVTRAGNYRFSKVTVGNNSIERYTSAPGVQAMPPEDAYYFNNYTEAYQYAPQLNAAMTIGIAYSNAASKVEATITNGTTEATVEGVMGLEAADQGDKSVNLWSFKIPAANDSQEGQWKLTGITMYGVYYDGKYYEEEGNGVRIDLTKENIYTKVVNYLYVALYGENQEFTNFFMEDNFVNDLRVTIADYEGEAVNGVTISNLKVVYYLDAASVSMDTYGYTAEGLDTINVTGTGTLKNESSTEYSISDMDFQTAGCYKNCKVSFDVGNSNFTAGGEGTVLHYMVNDKLSDSCPQYKVHWYAPTVTITGTNPSGSTKSNPTGGKSFNINVDSRGGTNLTETSVRNYYEDYYANVYAEVNSLFGYATRYTLPKVTMKLSDAGTKISSTNKAIFSYSYYYDSQSYTNTVEFQGNDKTGSMEIGALEGSSRRLVGHVIHDNIGVTYGGVTYTVKLKNPIEIRQENRAFTTVSYEIPAEYQNLFTAPSNMTSYDGRPLEAELPLMEAKGQIVKALGDMTTIYRYTEITQPIKWTTKTTGCNGTETTEHTGSKVTTTKETIQTGTFTAVERTYTASKWTIASTTVTDAPKTTTATYNAGTTRSITANKNVLSPIVTYTDKVLGDPYESTETLETTTDVVFMEDGDGTGTEINEPSGWENNGPAVTRVW